MRDGWRTALWRGWRASMAPRPRRRHRRLLIERLEARIALHAGHDHSDPDNPIEDPVDYPPPPAAETEPNNDVASSNAFTKASDTLTGSISSGADVDFFWAAFTQGEVLTVNPGTDPGQLHFAPAVEVQDAAGVVRARSLDGSRIEYTIPTAGTYYLRLFAQHAYGAFTSSYSVGVSTATFSGTTESEANDTLATADGVSTSANFRGTLATTADVDHFSFAGTAGRSVSFRFANLAAANPSLRLYNPSNVLVATDTTGTGLSYVLPTTGTYRFALGSDNDAGPVSGEYVGALVMSSSAPTLENAAADAFEGAPAWALSSTASRVAGRLTSLGDVDLFKVTFDAGSSYTFAIDSPTGNALRQGKTLALYNEWGQLLEWSKNGTLNTSAATGFGLRIERPGTHYLAVWANDPRGLSGYSITGTRSSTFPTQRDVPLYFHDYTAQTSHLGYTATINPPAQYVPLMVGLFEARYDIYDVDVTLTLPTGGTSHVGFGMGDFGSIGAYGYGGSFSLGTRRVSGQSVLDDPASGWTRLDNMRYPASVMNQETGHGSGMYAHARHPLAFMGYSTQSAMNVVGSYFPFPWTDTRVPDVEVRNEREYLDWALQAGRNALEVEGNDSLATAQNLTPFLNEMTGDADPRNDRVALTGRISSPFDVDLYRLDVAAGQTFAFDIDAAEFQSTLDAELAVFDAAGNLLASNGQALDRESGLRSVDPYLVQTFATAGTYYLRVRAEQALPGHYRLKVVSGAAFDADAPRVLAAWPNGGASADSTRQLIFWFDDQIDPDTLTAENVIVSGAVSGVRSGTLTWDSQDATLIFYADAALPADTYTVTFLSGASGLKDLRGNWLDGETDGALDWPQVSGDGLAGGDFTTTFTVTGADATAASVSSSSYSRNNYNRSMFTVTFNDELDIVRTYTANWTLRGAGVDAAYNTADDTFTPVDVLVDKMRMTSARDIVLYGRGVLEAGNYRLEAALRDAAGNNVNVSRTFTVSAPSYVAGPAVSDLNLQPGTTVAAGLDRIEVRFGSAVNPATLTPASFRLRYSVNPTFYDGDDTFVAEADGLIAYDAALRKATFQAAAALAEGYYLVELDGDAGGVADAAGRLLDGEYLDSHIAGSDLYSLWRDAPSGDGLTGGDYLASFAVAGPPPAVEGVFARGAAWTTAFLDKLAELDAGDATLGYRISSGPDQLDTLPWLSVDTLSLKFSKPVSVALGSLQLIGSASTAAAPAPTGFSYNASTNVATWTFAAPLPLNKYLLHVGIAVVDGLNQALDGEWIDEASVVSGDGLRGGPFNFRFDLVPGDPDDTQGVTFSEVAQTRLKIGRTTAAADYNYRQDLDGSGGITFSEVAQARLRIGSGVAGFADPLPPPAAPDGPESGAGNSPPAGGSGGGGESGGGSGDPPPGFDPYLDNDAPFVAEENEFAVEIYNYGVPPIRGHLRIESELDAPPIDDAGAAHDHADHEHSHDDGAPIDHDHAHSHDHSGHEHPAPTTLPSPLVGEESGVRSDLATGFFPAAGLLGSVASLTRGEGESATSGADAARARLQSPVTADSSATGAPAAALTREAAIDAALEAWARAGSGRNTARRVAARLREGAPLKRRFFVAPEDLKDAASA